MIDEKRRTEEGIEDDLAEEILNSANLIQFKIVYWGPGESGKTTNFRKLKNCPQLHHETNGYSIETTDGRTLWQDSLFLRFSINIADQHYIIITQIVTCTGQERFLATREYIIHGADGIIFVGDSEPEKLEQNKRSFRELLAFARPKGIPYVIQLNKRDLEDAIKVKEFAEALEIPPDSERLYLSTAKDGENVIEPFSTIIMTIIQNYFSQ